MLSLALLLGSLAGSALFASGCSSTPRPRRHHFQEEVDDEPGPTEEPLAKVVPWEDFALLPSLKTVGDPRISMHRMGDEWATTRSNPEAQGYATGGDLGPGALLVESLSADRESPVTTHFVMKKRELGYFPAGADWEFLVVNGKGGVEARGQLVRCARCHAEAPRQFVFGPAEKVRPSSGGG